MRPPSDRPESESQLRGGPDPASFELPDAFVRRYRPIRVFPDRGGASAYLFDRHELAFFRRMATGSAIDARAVWSAFPAGNGMTISSAEAQGAVGYVVTEIPASAGLESSYPMPRRLTHSQKRRRAVLRALLAELRSLSLPTADEVLAFIEVYAQR